MCRFYFSSVGCRYKNNCLFSHVKPVNWFKQDCWYHLNSKCAFGKFCFNYHRKNSPLEKDKPKICTSRSFETSNKNRCSVSATNKIKISNVKEGYGGTQKEKLCPNKNTRNSLKSEGYSFLKRELKMLKNQVKHLKDMVEKISTKSHTKTECKGYTNSIQAMVDTAKILDDGTQLSGNAQINKNVKKEEPMNMQEKSSKLMKEGPQQHLSSSETPKLANDEVDVKNQGTEEKSTINQEKCSKTKHTDFWKNLAIKGKRK